MTAQTIAKLLRGFLNSNQLTLSDIRKAMVVLSNGRLEPPTPETGRGNTKGKARKRDLGQPRKPNPQTLINKGHEDQESCFS